MSCAKANTSLPRPASPCHAEASNSSLFFPSIDMTYGWVANDCAMKLPYVCEVPADSFPCPPPSPPGPPPPLPPSPPFPPFPPNCECQLLCWHYWPVVSCLSHVHPRYQP
jgi:hypothetical protein